MKPKHLQDHITQRARRYPMAGFVQARAAFVHGEGSLQEISKIVKIPLTALRRYYEAEDWSTRRKLFQIAAAKAADQAALDQIRYPDGQGKAPKGAGRRQIERCNAALELCHDPDEVIKWTRALESAMRITFLEEHGHYPAQGKPAAQEPQQARPAPAAPGSRRVSPLIQVLPPDNAPRPGPDQPED